MNVLSLLKAVIKKAGHATLVYYKRGVVVHYKKPYHAPVTAADIASQKILLEGLAPFGYAVLSEERAPDAERLTRDHVWIIDPLDGTKDFLQKDGEFSIMVALVERGRPMLAAVYQPTADLLYYASEGHGAWSQRGEEAPVRLRVSSKMDPRQFVMLISRNHLLATELDVAETLGIERRVPCGSAGLKIGLIASGQAELLINSSDKTGEWDTAASDCILREAGGMMTDMHGRALQYNKKNPKNLDGFVASNGATHDRVIEALRTHV